MKNRKRLLTYIICLVLFYAKALAQTDTTAVNKDSTTFVTKDSATFTYQDSTSNQRYCEIVVVKGSLLNLVVRVYNTLGYNACPIEQWKVVNTDKLKKQFSAHAVVANGPRYYLADKIGIYDGDSITTINVDSLQLKEWFKMRMSLAKALSMKNNEPYKERSYKLATASFFNKGSTVFELVTPEHTYVMGSYSAEVDSSLTAAGLPNLAQRLKLPDGWTYKVVVLDNDLQLITTEAKESYGLEDEFGNRYQRVD